MVRGYSHPSVFALAHVFCAVTMVVSGLKVGIFYMAYNDDEREEDVDLGGTLGYASDEDEDEEEGSGPLPAAPEEEEGYE